MEKIVRVLISSLELSDEIRDLNRYDNLRNSESFRDNEIPNADLWLSYPNAGEEFIGMKKDENDGAARESEEAAVYIGEIRTARVRSIHNIGIQRVAHGHTQPVSIVPHTYNKTLTVGYHRRHAHWAPSAPSLAVRHVEGDRYRRNLTQHQGS